MDLISAIQYVGSGLALVAFIVAAILMGYRSSIQTREQQLNAMPEADRLRALETMSEYIGIDINAVPVSQRTMIAMRQLELKAERQRQLMTIALVTGILLAIVSIAAMWSFGQSTGPGFAMS